ncbi:MAG TPA: response regulator [Burkholderiales bacterium]
MARIGKYVVMGELGGQGLSTVHSTLDPVIGRQVAVKRVSKQGDAADVQAYLERLRLQAAAAGNLHHTNIVGMYEYGEDDAAAWLAMEMVQGKSLRQHLADGYRAVLEPLSQLVVQILEALEYAHGRGVVHGNVCAENVLVDASGEAKLIGFTGHGEEASDVVAAKALLAEMFGALPPGLEEQQTARGMLGRLRGASAPVGLADKARALRRAATGIAEPAPPPQKKPAVLFVDDEERVLHALSGLFEGQYQVESASNAEAALERLKARRFLVIVSDQRMPGMTGVELLRESRRLAPHSVRLLLTGYSDFDAIVASVNESEIFRFISKPWQQDELQATLAEAVDVAIAAEAAAAGGALRVPVAGNVLVVGDAAMARSIRELSAGGLHVLEAASDDAALEIVSHEDIGAVVCELDPRAREPEALLRVLKDAAPNTQLVVVAEAGDAELAIRLINEARIHRYLPKPANLLLLQQAVASALVRYSRLQNRPGLAGVEGAIRNAWTARARALLERLKALGGRLRITGNAAR